MTAFGKFVNTIVGYEAIIKQHSLLSWNGINLGATEPEIIKDYLLTSGVGVDYLNRNIAAKIHNNTQYTVKFASVYAHSKPRITRTANSIANCTGDTGQCELGDLMLALVFIDKNKKIIHASAHLAQAKKDPVLTSASQQCLYDKDLEFEMPANAVRESVTQHSLRRLPDYTEQRIHALSYLILKPGVSIRQVPWSSNMGYGYEHFIYRMLIGDIGKSFKTPIAGEEEWNCIVDDMINIGTGKVSSSTVRGYGLPFILDKFNYFFFLGEYKMEIPDDGIPTIYIIVQDNELG